MPNAKYYCLGCGVTKDATHFENSARRPNQDDLAFFSNNIGTTKLEDIRAYGKQHHISLKAATQVCLILRNSTEGRMCI